jgi:hypothetical protein
MDGCEFSKEDFLGLMILLDTLKEQLSTPTE